MRSIRCICSADFAAIRCILAAFRCSPATSIILRIVGRASTGSGGHSTRRQHAESSIIDGIVPFGEYIEGFSDCGNEGYTVKAEVHTEDLKQPTLCLVIRAKPPFSQRLREIKHFEGNLSLFRSATTEALKLTLGVREAVTQFNALRRERIGIHLFKSKRAST